MRKLLTRHWRNLCGLATAGLVLSATCAANDLTWAPGTGGDWDTTTPNWNPGPTTFTNGGVDSVTFNHTNGGTKSGVRKP